MQEAFPTQFKYLKTAFAGGNLHHSYIFHGPRSEGKLDFALYFARFIQCEKKGKDAPCEECKSCHLSNEGIIPNTYILDKGEASVGIEDIRELQKKEELSVGKGQKKVFIINGAQGLTKEAREALLKTLEEPSEQSIIILITDERKNLTKTILSRCPSIFFPVSADLSLESIGNVEYVENMIIEVGVILGNRWFEKMILAKEVSDEKNPRPRAEDWLKILYAVFLLKNHDDRVDPKMAKVLTSLEKTQSYDKIVEVLEKTYNLLGFLDTNVSKRVLFEDFMLNV